MHENPGSGIFPSGGLGQFGAETGVYGTTARPQQQTHAVGKKRLFAVSADIHQSACRLGKSETLSRIDTQISVRQKKHRVAVFQRPAHHSVGIG